MQGWVFAMAKSIFARTVEKPVKTGKNWQKKAKTGTYKIVQKLINEIGYFNTECCKQHHIFLKL